MIFFSLVSKNRLRGYLERKKLRKMTGKIVTGKWLIYHLIINTDIVINMSRFAFHFLMHWGICDILNSFFFKLRFSHFTNVVLVSAVQQSELAICIRNAMFITYSIAQGILFNAHSSVYIGLPCSSNGKESACNARDPSLIHGSERSSGEGNGNPFQYSCLKNPMEGEPGGLQSQGKT